MEHTVYGAIPMPEAAEPAHSGGSAWRLPAAIAIVALIVAGVLGGLLFRTTGQLHQAVHGLAVTKAALARTSGELATTKVSLRTAQTDLAAEKQTAAYAHIYIADAGRVTTAYDAVPAACSGQGSSCVQAVMQFRTNVEKFQADRAAATVPSGLKAGDTATKNALAQMTAGLNEIDAADSADLAKIDAGSKKVDQGMVNLAKAEAVVGSAIS